MNKTRLAAIMFTDIVGYTATMGKDTEAALNMVQKTRAIQKPLVEKYRGQWIKEMGDGVLAQFESAVEAIQCALEIQKAISADSLERKLRIGIHLGDIVFQNGDVYGEGVNLAARLESISTPGSVFISDSVYHAIKSRKGFVVTFLGEKKLKNVQEPVRTYQVESGEAIGRTSSRLNDKLKIPKKFVFPIVLLVLVSLVLLWRSQGFLNGGILSSPTLAVLPFNVIDDNPENEYFGEGLTVELIHGLGKISSLSVINFPTAIRYMGMVNPGKTAFDELTNVDYFVTGTTKKTNSAVQLAIQVLNTEEDTIWQNIYSWDVSSTPKMAGTIARDISTAIKVKLNSEESSRLTDIDPINPEVYELLLKGLTSISKYNFTGFAQGMVYLQEAVDKNPGNADAWAGLAEGYVYMGHSPNPPPDAWQKAKAAAIRAIKLDSAHALAWASLAHTKTYFEWDYEGAEIAYHKANKLNPNLAMNHYHYAWHLDLFGRIDEAIVEHKKAQQLDPFFPMHTAWLAWLLFKDGQPEEALREARKSLEIVKNFPLGYFNLGHIYLLQEKYDSAIFYMEKAAENQPLFRYSGLASAYIESGQKEKGMEMIIELESKPLNSIGALNLAMLYARLDSVDKYFHYINYEPAHAFVPWTRVNTTNPLIRKDLRFKTLMDKMNLPLPE